MLEFYFGFSLFLTVVGGFTIVICFIVWALTHADAKKKSNLAARRNLPRDAKRALYSLSLPLLAWLWPLTVPAAILYLLSRVAKDAIHNNPTD